MIDTSRAPDIRAAAAGLKGVWEAGLRATRLLREAWNPERGAPVFTEAGRYTARGWTEWTQGFQFGNALYLFEAAGDGDMLEYGRRGTVECMAGHLTHTGVHDHGFSTVSTYGNLLRLMHEGRIGYDRWEAEFYALALRVSGAVQAARWTAIDEGLGFIHSFNGGHSLFTDTVRSLRVLALGHQLGGVLMGEQDERISLLGRLAAHAESTARWNVYFGRGRDVWDVRGRTVHESLFNVKSGTYRCPSTQQGYSPFSTWTRGAAWAAAGYAELLEWLGSRDWAENPGNGGEDGFEAPGLNRDALEARWIECACAVCDFIVENSPSDGIPYWDTGAPGLVHLGDYLGRPADPFNEYEPVDSSAAAIGAQGLYRLGVYLEREARRLSGMMIDPDGGGARRVPAAEIRGRGEGYRHAALVTAAALFAEPYLSVDEDHQGILLHSIYHRPGGWDYVGAKGSVPGGESCMWGDYHLLELAVMIKRENEGLGAQRFFDVGEVPGAPGRGRRRGGERAGEAGPRFGTLRRDDERGDEAAPGA